MGANRQAREQKGYGEVGGDGGLVGAVGHWVVLVAIDVKSKMIAKWQDCIFQVSFRFIHCILLASLVSSV